MTDVRPVDTQIPHSLLDSASLGRKEALAIWRQSLDAIYDVRLRAPDDSGFQFRAEAFHFGEVVLTAYRCSAQTFDRSRARIGRDGVDHYTLQFCLSGRHGRRDAAGDGAAARGDLLIADLAQPHATATSDFDSLNLTIPRRLFAPLLDAADEQNLRLIPGSAPLTALLRNHLIGLFAGARSLSAREAESVVSPTLALAATVLNAKGAGTGEGAPDPILAAQIRRFLSDRAVDPTLTPEGVAARFGLSRRKLYYLLEPHGGFTTFLRERRLHLAYAMLRDPQQRGRSIGEVAASCGFAWRTNFARTFRARFGMSPREVRTLAGQSPLPFPEGPPDRHMWDWIRSLR